MKTLIVKLFFDFMRHSTTGDREAGLVVRTFLLLIVTVIGWTTAACAQSTSRRLMPTHSLKELVAEDSAQDGIVQVRIGQLFKEGATEYTPIDRKTLKDAPPLPTGFIPFRDQTYRITTDAMVSGEHIVVFHFPSAANQAEFKRLEVLYLAEDEMSPFGRSWIPVTVTADGWDENTIRSISKTTYDQLLPDFSSRRVAAISEGFGIFAIAIAPETYDAPKEPFTRIELIATSSPETARRNEKVTHTFVIKNRGPVRAEEVNFKEELGTDLDFESALASQGRCQQSNRSSNRVLCHLGPMTVGASITVKITMRVNEKALFVDDLRTISSTTFLAFKQRPTDFINEKNYLIVEVKTAMLKDL